MSKEGVDFRFKIKPLTAIGITIVTATFGFGVGKISFTYKKPFIKYESIVIPVSTPSPTPNPWRTTAFSGTLRFSVTEGKYYLLTNSSEAINIDVLENVSLNKLIGRRIFATGEYNDSTHTLIISDSADMELLPKKVEIVPIAPEPTIIPTPIPTILPTEEPEPEFEASDEAKFMILDNN
jgi:hypothetical protein